MKKFVVGTAVVLGVLIAIDYAITYMVEQEEVMIVMKGSPN